MKAKDMRELSVNELTEKLSDLKAELFNLRFQHAINQLENPLRMKDVKRDIARVKTLLRENELKSAQYARGRTKVNERKKSQKNPCRDGRQRQDG